MDWTKWLTNEFLEDHAGRTIAVIDVNERYKVEVRVVDTKEKDNKPGTGNTVTPKRR